MTDTVKEARRSRLVLIDGLKPHPKNYRTHPEDQIEHLMESLREFGFYRNVVIAKDSTILAGHGIVEAARRLGYEKVPSERLNIDPDSPLALKLLAADNYLPHFSEDDDRLLTELLREVRESESLLGTGFDDQSLAALVMVTRDASEIADFDAAAEWVGMPAYDSDDPISVAVSIQFDTEADRAKFVDKMDLEVTMRHGRTWSTWWPPRVRNDISSLRWDDG